MEQKLKGRRIAALATDGCEKVEFTIPMYALRLAGAHVDVVSIRHGRIRCVNLLEPANRVGVDKTLDEADARDYDALLLPGGFINPDLLRQSQQAREFVRAFDTARKPIASLCHGPWVLASAGLLEGRTLTSWPGVRDDLVNAGATWLDHEAAKRDPRRPDQTGSKHRTPNAERGTSNSDRPNSALRVMPVRLGRSVFRVCLPLGQEV